MIYNNRVLIGNWFEEQNFLTLQRNGNICSTTYQYDYAKRDIPVRDDRLLWRIKQKSLVMQPNYNLSHEILTELK